MVFKTPSLIPNTAKRGGRAKVDVKFKESHENKK